jgi:pimeloyl-ACP methyl ester carboxylesterase
VKVAIRGGDIAVDVRGAEDAPPILLCRPLGGSMVSWASFADRLVERARVIAFDVRGTGQSSAAPWSTTTRRIAGDALAVLDTLGIARAHIYGISLGGMVATWLAIDCPDRIDRLVLASSTSRRALVLARCLTKSPPEMEACLATRILSTAFRHANPAAVDLIRDRARIHPASRRSVGVLLAAAARHDARDHLTSITAPTLVLAGSRDELITQAQQRNLADEIPHARFEVIEAGHDLSAEAPTLVATRVLQHVLHHG